MPDTAETAAALLAMLTDEELARYGEIARDQASHEMRYWGLQGTLAMSAAGAAVWALAGLEAGWLSRSFMATLATAAALGYSPYRRVKNWTLWRRHVRAVDTEQVRRKQDVADEAAKGTG